MSRHHDDWTHGEPRLVLGVCDDCENRWYLPRDHCPRCGSGRSSSRQSSGDGLCVAVTRSHVTGEVGGAPLSLALVQLDEGPVVMGRVRDELVPGDRARVEFVPDGTGTALVPSFSRRALT
ncbi:Zn-ribbon domain-containing OB-fold protein [Blastococcus capsensis]|uniref:Zn-ribbon domain-containing OB-fold protein n=1 Tax=Blastococcus capsensis TaxID=1564163 RepID=UPI00253FF992|nr:zinc ribbon domain-containing protein [Blastococcus capsensis]MDK3257773.1 zinc ribbon domain-containing protein [Blastococcus capsensis]